MKQILARSEHSPKWKAQEEVGRHPLHPSVRWLDGAEQDLRTLQIRIWKKTALGKEQW
jgi:hypothetical protein